MFRKEDAVPVAVDVGTLVGDVVRLLRAAKLAEGIDIRLALAEPLPAVFGDPVQFEQVLLNIVMNACEAINASADGPRAITIQSRPGPPGHVLVEVIDSGTGAGAAAIERMFEHFVSTKAKGLGMGLAISRSIVNSHGGLLWATANPDRGLTLHIELVAWASDIHGGAKAPHGAVKAAG
jgi:signal transduction histidine kinase